MNTIQNTYQASFPFSKGVLCLFMLLLSQLGLSQYTVSGDNYVNVNDTEEYRIMGSGPSYGKTQWYANGGTIGSYTLSTARVRNR